jgi:hypothetical protein
MKKNLYKKINILIISVFFVGVFFNFNTASALTVNTYQQTDESAGYSIPPENTANYATIYTIGHADSWTGNLNNGFSLVLSSDEQNGTDVAVGFESCCMGLGGYFVSTNTVHVTGKAVYTFTFSGRTDLDNPYGWNAHLYRVNNNDQLTIYGQAYTVPSVMQYPAYYLNTSATAIDPTCSDGILNGDETAIDKGGSCFYVSLNDPQDQTTIKDFEKWTVAYYGNDANTTSPTLQKAVMWSTDAGLLSTCLHFPDGSATWANCFGGSTVVHIDYAPSVWVSLSNYTSYVEKTGTLQAGQLYYARALLYTIDDNSLQRTALISYGNMISFRVESVGGSTSGGACNKDDFACILGAVIKGIFVPSDASLLQFADFKNLLASKAPFGYAIAIYSELTTLHYTADAPVFVLQQVTPITNLIFNPLRVGLAWVLWFAFAFFLLKRFKDINI